MTYYRPLTPEFRRKTLDRIMTQMQELDTCQPTAFVTAQKVGLAALENLFRALPDGYPIPFERTVNNGTTVNRKSRH